MPKTYDVMFRFTLKDTTKEAALKINHAMQYAYAALGTHPDVVASEFQNDWNKAAREATLEPKELATYRDLSCRCWSYHA